MAKHWTYSFPRRLSRRLSQEWARLRHSAHSSALRPRPKFAILDDSFPWENSGFRFLEYSALLTDRVGSVAFTQASYRPDWLARVREFEETAPQIAQKVHLFDARITRSPNAAYVSFLFNAVRFEPWLSARKVPFVVQLYPGGDFGLDDPESDSMLKKIFNSDSFRGVVCTQSITSKYVRSRFNLQSEQICEVYGAPYWPSATIQEVEHERQRRERLRHHINVGFAANRYTPGGIDKGFDTFCWLADQLRCEEHVRFFCFGPWTHQDAPTDCDVTAVMFCGSMPPRRLQSELCGMDIFLNPVRSNLLKRGAFDGFPTTTAAMAAIAGCAVITTDPERLHVGICEDGRDLLILQDNRASWADVLRELIRAEASIRHLSRNAQVTFRRYFCREYQMSARNEFFDRVF